MNFRENILALKGQYYDNLEKLTYDSTERIFYLRKIQNNELKTTSINKIVIGKFYLIKYNYNGNKIYCPIFPLEFKIHKNKNILYAVNLDYLPYLYKVDFFSKIFDIYDNIYQKNKDIASVNDELPFNSITFENIYKLLKGNGGYEYSVTAFDLLKIKEVNVISTNIVHRFLFLNTKIVNSAMMKELLTNTTVDEYIDKLKNIINEYDNLKISYDEDTKDFYKRLRNFEQNFKLIDI
jgi:hypothetical protein